MSITIDQFKERISDRHPRLVFPEGSDDRIIEAAARLRDEELAASTLLGTHAEIEESAAEIGVDLTGIEVIDPSEAREDETYVSAYQGVRSVSAETAKKILGNELLFGALLVKQAGGDALIGGCVRTSGDLISAAKEVIGLREEIGIPSSFFHMELPDGRTLVYADAAVTVDPSADELADIAVASARSSAALLDDDPKVALLSFSTRGSAAHPDVETVQDATELAKAAAPEFDIDGEFQADAALDEATARRKIDGEIGPVAGNATTLVFPDLDAGNIAYKLTQELAGANAYGPVLQGFARPVCDLSRGASVEDIVGAAVITATLVE
jgi:phosphate acetyltransferase